ncbi:hypothetical protein SAMN05421827_11026 [Pedobacter terrae]|uniref:Uncharacterized protein n=1 Tax=Pedobacter terrae TaxID=405671 RepID=A0A1G7WKG1_9SPHI|nr:hypothetical protein [Pedobacter terrae]SDG72433.1 hypothetical protein SAMN05421827_11026 [Pedobacter terrae]
MKRTISTISLGIIGIIMLASFNISKTSEYDIADLYQSTDLNANTKALTEDGVKEVSVLLTPIKLDVGKYVVSLTKKGKDLYKIDGKNIYIETKYCYEYATGEEVVLKIESTYGYSKGKVIF